MKTCTITLLVTLLFFNVEVESERKKVIYDVKSARRLFKEYSNKFKWSFQGDSDEERRYDNFLENLKLINEHNLDPNVNVYYQIGPYHHLSPKEFLFIYKKTTSSSALYNDKGLLRDIIEMKKKKKKEES